MIASDKEPFDSYEVTSLLLDSADEVSSPGTGGGFHWEACSYTLHSDSGDVWLPASRSCGLSLSVHMQRTPAATAPGGTGFRWHRN